MELNKINTDNKFFFLIKVFKFKTMKRVYQFKINSHLIVVGAESYCKLCPRRHPKNYRWMSAVIA